MLKQILALIILSIIIILGMQYAQYALHLLLSAHNWVASELKDVFSNGPTGSLIRQLIALLIIPFAVSFIPGLILWLAKRQWFGYFMELVWIIWLLQTSAVIIASKAA